MSAFTMTLGTLRAYHVRLWLPWTGIWLADVEIDLPSSQPVPSGAQTLTIGATTLAGTVDARRAGRFGDKASLRLVGGGAGWQKKVPERHWHNDGGVTLASVIETTASEIGERAKVLDPAIVGDDFTRAGDNPASDVLLGRSWYVDLAGATVVGARPTPTAPKSLELLGWVPLEQRAELACDDVVQPGTVLTDSRIGTAVVRDVEQTFGDDGARATVWCGATEMSRLVEALVALVRQRSGRAFLAAYRYRIVLAEGDRLALQAVDPAAGQPDMLPISVWPGMAGLSATYTPGTECLVEFIAGDPARPVVTSFQNQPPQSMTLDAGEVNVGGAGATALAIASLVNAQFTALANAFTAWTPVPNDGGAALKALLTTLGGTGWPHSVSASKAKGV